MEHKDRPNVVRELVLPGDLLSDDGKNLRAGQSTFKEGGKIYAAQLGLKSQRSSFLNVIPLKGAYIPRPDDLLIGTVIGISPSTWLIDINSPYPAPLHVNEVPWRVDFGETSQYLNIGDSLLLKVFSVDEIKRIQVSMKNRQSRKLHGGHLVKITPSKVPRIIGKNGSMISMIKKETRCRMFVGQNGCIWLDGDPLDVLKAVQAVNLIEENAHKMGLTDRVKEFLTEQMTKEKPYVKREGGEAPEDDPETETEGIPAEEPAKIEEVTEPAKFEEVAGPAKFEEIAGPAKFEEIAGPAKFEKIEEPVEKISTEIVEEVPMESCGAISSEKEGVIIPLGKGESSNEKEDDSIIEKNDESSSEE